MAGKHRYDKTNGTLAETLESLVPHQRNIVGNQGKTQSLPIRLRHKPVAWGFPLDEIIFSKWLLNTMMLPIMPWDTICYAQSTYLPEARNTIHSDFINNRSVEWLVMLDSDVCPPPDFLDRLLAHKKPMVGGWYRKKTRANEPVVYDFDKFDDNGLALWNIRHESGQDLEKVDGAGAGCWLMHRSVAEAIGEKPYDMTRGGEDLDLCLKVKQAGFDIYIDWRVACAHAGVALY
jgi:hypothetical protein